MKQLRMESTPSNGKTFQEWDPSFIRALKDRVPPEIFKDYIVKYKSLLENGMDKTKRVPLSDIYWIVHDMNKDSLLSW